MCIPSLSLVISMQDSFSYMAAEHSAQMLPIKLT